MKILHYFLGFPPYRTGGLTKYAYDLMCSQIDNGDEVSALWPGMIELKNNRPRIRKQKGISGINNYELVNPLPVPLDEGIKETDAFIKTCDLKIYIDLLENIKPEVIHIHTLMGIHKEFFQAANELKIRIVFTAHDYFGLCPKVTLFKRNDVCDDDHCCNDCVFCNQSALSLKKIWLMQSPLYRNLKNLKFIKFLRNKHRIDFFNDQILPSQTLLKDVDSKKYVVLRQFYIEMLSMVDCIHFNSTITESVYKRYFIPENSMVVNITHKDIADNREKNTWSYTGKLRITSLAPAKPFKGFNVMIQALDELWQSGKRDFELKIFCPVPVMKPYISIQEGGFEYSQLPQIMADTDILIAPSVWYETFGFTVLEALSYGVPVIVSDHVGAKDIVQNCGIIVRAGDIEDLKNAIERLDEETLRRMRENIKKDFQIETWIEYVNKNYSLYSTNDVNQHHIGDK